MPEQFSCSAWAKAAYAKCRGVCRLVVFRPPRRELPRPQNDHTGAKIGLRQTWRKKGATIPSVCTPGRNRGE